MKPIAGREDDRACSEVSEVEDQTQNQSDSDSGVRYSCTRPYIAKLNF